MEFVNSAHELELLTIKISMRETAIPKRYRYVLARPLCESARQINQCITYANSIVPKTADEYYRRKSFQKRALNEIKNYLELMRLTTELLPIKASTITEWSNAAYKEYKAVTAWTQADAKRYAHLDN